MSPYRHVNRVSPADDQLFALTRTYHRLTALSDRLHGPYGISTATRSILLLLESRGPLTLSDIARDRAVSRQFIQRMAAPLVQLQAIETVANPRSRRSPLLALTGKGRVMVAGIHAREAPLRAALADSIPAAELETLAQILAKFEAALARLAPHDGGS